MSIEVIAQVRLIIDTDDPLYAKDEATEMLNQVVTDIEHIEVKR